MTLKTHLTLALAAWGLALSAPGARAADAPLGVWIDDTGRGAVEIKECGKGKLCGRLVWLQDTKNAKACGTAILGDVAKVGGSWDGGWIYSPEKNAKYDVELTPEGSDKLTVLGYAGTKLFSKEMTWTRAPADLKRCDVQEAKADVAAPAAAAGPRSATAAPVVTSSNGKPADGPAVVPIDKAAADKAAASEPSGSTQTAKPADTKTADASDVTEPRPQATARPATRKRAHKREICRVDAPFVRVEFYCDDDD